MQNKKSIPPEQKLAAVQEYLTGQLGSEACAAKYGVSCMALRNWRRRYKIHGAAGLEPATNPGQYSAETKQAAVQEYLSGGVSLTQMCEKYDIIDTSSLRLWIKRYNSHGGFSQPKTIGATSMTKGRKTTADERIEIVSYCMANGKNYAKAIEIYGVSYAQLLRWVKKYEQDGVAGLADRRGKRKSESAMSEVEKLRAQLKFKERENVRLQMEVDLLKKLDALERGRDKG